MEVKGGMRITNYSYVVITSNTEPSSWWPGIDLAPLKALVLEGDGMYIEFREQPTVSRNGQTRVGGIIETPVWHRPVDINRTLPKYPDPPQQANTKYYSTPFYIFILHHYTHTCSCAEVALVIMARPCLR